MALWEPAMVHPGLVAVFHRAMDKLLEWRVPFKAYSGTRTFVEQAEIYAKGRTAPGDIVTNAKPGQSIHNYGCAIDAAPLKDKNNPKGLVYWPSKRPLAEEWLLYEKAIMEAADEIDAIRNDGVDYEWGGRWRGIVDAPHVQVRTTLNELRAGMYPYCADVEWLVKAHTSFLWDTSWMKRRQQYLLNICGYSAGPVDGVIGTKSLTAWTAYANDMKIDRMDSKGVIESLVRSAQTLVSIEI